jgi:calcium-dependent protein kinase
MGCCSSIRINRQVFIRSSVDISPEEEKSVLVIESSSFIIHKTNNLKDDYVLGPSLGSGTFGSVFSAVHKLSGQERAIKTMQKSLINLDKNHKSKFFAEVDILRKTDHPNIVRLFEFYEDSRYFHLITEVVKGGELFDYLLTCTSLSESTAKFFFKQILCAVNYCHSKGIVHRDLKPENLLLMRKSPDSLLKVIDFGTSTLITPNQTIKGKIGTAYYMAPEVIKGHYNEKCDIWSCGVILFLLLSGKPPFNGKTEKEIIFRAEKGRFSFRGDVWDSISAEAKSLITQMLEPDINQRISASDALIHSWISLPVLNSLPSLNTLSIALINIANFQTQSKLQQAVLSFIATQLANKEENLKLSKIFTALDTDGDGRLSKEELLNEFLKTRNFEQAEAVVLKVMKEVDINRSGFIDYSEFLMASMKIENLLCKNYLESAFKAFDYGGKGWISVCDLERVLGNEVGNQGSVWNDLIEKVDRNNDGLIDLQEFIEMMLNIF